MQLFEQSRKNKAAQLTGKAGLLELDYEERTARRNAHAAA